MDNSNTEKADFVSAILDSRDLLNTFASTLQMPEEEKNSQRISMKVLKIDDEGKRDNKNPKDHPDISHIPNDQPLPSEYPEEDPRPIPKNEPSEPEVPGPIQAPMEEPNKRPKIRVLNIEY